MPKIDVAQVFTGAVQLSLFSVENWLTLKLANSDNASRAASAA